MRPLRPSTIASMGAALASAVICAIILAQQRPVPPPEPQAEQRLNVTTHRTEAGTFTLVDIPVPLVPGSTVMQSRRCVVFQSSAAGSSTPSLHCDPLLIAE